MLHDLAVLGLLDWLEARFGEYVVAPLSRVLFFDVWFWDDETEFPIVVLWLIVAAVFFTLRFGFVNVRAFRHALDCVRGRYSSGDDPGELSHFQALSAALAATLGLGNIAGVAVAIGIGGPGACFWMTLAGVLGMSAKFAECTLGQRYRVIDERGRVSGGPMHYLHRGLAELGLPRTGRALAVLFSLMCIGGSLGGGNMFQANQAYRQVAEILPALDSRMGASFFGLGLAFAVGLVIIGGIRRIGRVAETLVPFMCLLYMAAGGFILALHAAELPAAFAAIVGGAFRPEAAFGGAVGVLVQGFRRAAFSNEAGIGSAPIAHSTASTREPVREGIVALLEPFIDTVVVCNMTALVLVVTRAYAHPEAGEGIAMTSWAFATVLPWYPVVLAVSALLFAYATQIAWSYYGERCWSFLFGERSSLAFKLLFLACTWFGCVSQLGPVVEFSDLMILGMAFPNLPGVVMLSGRIKADLDLYLARLRAGEFATRW